jgi:hypothetical protein
MSRSNNNVVFMGLAAAASVSLLFYFLSQQQQESASKKTAESEKRTAVASESPKSRGVDSGSAAAASSSTGGTADSGVTSTPPRSKTAATESNANANDKTPKVRNTNINKSDEKHLHSQIEALDKKGKVLFKNKQVRFRVDIGCNVMAPAYCDGVSLCGCAVLRVRREPSAASCQCYMRSPYSIHSSSLFLYLTNYLYNVM